MHLIRSGHVNGCHYSIKKLLVYSNYAKNNKAPILRTDLSSPLLWGNTALQGLQKLLHVAGGCVFRPSFLRGNWHREAVVLLLDHVSKGECVFPVEEEIFEVFSGRLEICGKASIMSTEQPPSTNFLANVTPRGPVLTTRRSTSISLA